MSNDDKVEVISAIVIDKLSDISSYDEAVTVPVQLSHYSGGIPSVYLAVVNGYLRIVQPIGEKRLVSSSSVTTNVIVDYIALSTNLKKCFEEISRTAQPEQPDETITNLSARVDSLASELSVVAKIADTRLDALTKQLRRLEGILNTINTAKQWENPQPLSSPIFTKHKSPPLPHRLMTDEEAGEWLTAYKEGLK